MTFCPGCGTENDISTKYCRECGKRLPASEPDLGPQPPGPVAPSESDAELGDILYQGFQFYETGDYTQAGDCCRRVLEINPQSGSAHTLLSMMFEKQGDAALHDGDAEAAKAFYLQAVQARERVLKLSPGSVVDVQKLKELKRKLNGDRQRAHPDVKAVALNIRTRVSKVPTPVLVSIAAAVLVFFAAFAIMGAGGEKKQPAQPASSTDLGQFSNRAPASSGQPYPGTYPQQQYPTAQEDPSASADESEGDDEMLFTDPEPPGASSTAAPSPAPAAQSPVPKMPPPQFKLPEQVGPLPNVQIVPIEPPKKPADQKHEEEVAPKPVQPAPQQNQMQLEVKTEKTGSDYQRDAMQLYRAGNTSQAAEMFRKAVNAYTEEMSRGKNAEAASAGIRTCKSYLQILDQ